MSASKAHDQTHKRWPWRPSWRVEGGICGFRDRRDVTVHVLTWLEFQRDKKAARRMSGTGETVSIAGSGEEGEAAIKAQKDLFASNFSKTRKERIKAGALYLAALAYRCLPELRTLPCSRVIPMATQYSNDANYGNWELSADCANSARRLLQQDGVRQDQVTQVRGYADQLLRVKSNPVDPSNRRISILVKNLVAAPARSERGAGVGEGFVAGAGWFSGQTGFGAAGFANKKRQPAGRGRGMGRRRRIRRRVPRQRRNLRRREACWPGLRPSCRG